MLDVVISQLVGYNEFYLRGKSKRGELAWRLLIKIKIL